MRRDELTRQRAADTPKMWRACGGSFKHSKRLYQPTSKPNGFVHLQ
jgi:hypothetical protein